MRLTDQRAQFEVDINQVGRIDKGAIVVPEQASHARFSYVHQSGSAGTAAIEARISPDAVNAATTGASSVTTNDSIAVSDLIDVRAIHSLIFVVATVEGAAGEGTIIIDFTDQQ